MWYIVLKLLITLVQQSDIKIIPPTPLTIPMTLSTVHGKIIWTDKDGVNGSQIITQAQYQAIGNGIPPKPAAFTGTSQEWINCWNRTAGVAYAFGGRQDIDTPSKEYELGTVAEIDNGWRIYLGNQDSHQLLYVYATDFSGTMPTINMTSKCGVSISAGVISGTVSLQCARLSDGKP